MGIQSVNRWLCQPKYQPQESLPTLHDHAVIITFRSSHSKLEGHRWIDHTLRQTG